MVKRATRLETVEVTADGDGLISHTGVALLVELVRHSQRTHLKLDRDWPWWSEALDAAFQHLRTIPALC